MRSRGEPSSGLSPGSCHARAGSCGGPGIFREPADDEGREEQQPWLDRAEVVHADLDRPSAPTLAVEDRELTISVGERIALAPGARGPQGQLMTTQRRAPPRRTVRGSNLPTSAPISS